MTQQTNTIEGKKEIYLFTIREARRGFASELHTYISSLSPVFSDVTVKPWNRQKVVAFQHGFDQAMQRIEDFIKDTPPL
jgi:hypothetical protein